MEALMKFGNVPSKYVSVAFAVAVLLSLVVAVGFVLPASQRVAARADKDKAVRNLETLRAKYSGIQSVHLVASAKIAIYGGDFRAGTGTYEYWAEGDRYKTKSRTDNQLGFNTDVDVAYDGKRFYYFDHGSGILSYRQQDEPKSQAALPNPLFLPVDYLSNDDDDCMFCVLRLPDLKADNTRWRNRAQALEVKSQMRDIMTGKVISEVEMPGGKLNNRPFKLRVRTSELSEGTTHPVQIDRVAPDGKTLVSTTFDNFAPSALGQFPRTISMKVFDDNGQPTLQSIFTVTTLEINGPIDDRVFSISFDEAAGVWDSDEKRFVKEKPAKPSGPLNQ
jgi:hypothetical protein